MHSTELERQCGCRYEHHLVISQRTYAHFSSHLETKKKSGNPFGLPLFLCLSDLRRLVEVSQLVVRMKNILDLVAIEVNHVLTSLTAVLTWVEVLWVQSKCLTNTSSEGKTRVRVDVDLANSALRSLCQLLLWNTYCVWQLATELVDDVNIFLRN